MKQNYGAGQFMVLFVIMGLAVAIPIFVFGLGTTISFFKFMFGPTLTNGIPVWAILVAGIVVVMMLRANKRRQIRGY